MVFLWAGVLVAVWGVITLDAYFRYKNYKGKK